MVDFPTRLKELRIKQGISQSKLAGILGFSRSTIANYEHDTRFPSQKTLISIADYFDVSLDYLLGRTTNKVATGLFLLKKIEEVENYRNNINNLVDVLSRTVYLNVPDRLEHNRQVCQLTSALGEKMKLDKKDMFILRIGSLLHDIGMLHIPDSLLNKRGKMDSTEFQLIKRHPRIGYQLVKELDLNSRLPAIVLQHHERLDGTGYPGGLTGNKICKESQIIGLADVVEALLHNRCYRKKYSIPAVLRKISSYQGDKFDTEIVSSCIELLQKGFNFKN